MQGDRGRAQQSAQDRAHRPQGVQRIDDRAAVAALHPQSLGVLRDIGHRIRGTGREQRTGEGDGHGAHTGRQGEQRQQQTAPHGHPRRPEPPYQPGCRQPGDQCTGRERRHRQSERRVRQAQLRLDLRIPGQQPGEQRTIGQKQHRDRGAGTAVADIGNGSGGKPVTGAGDPGSIGASHHSKGAMSTELLGLFPTGSRVDDDGTVVVGGCRLDDLAAEFGTPVLVVDEDALRNRARDYLAASAPLAPVRHGVRLKSIPVHGNSAGDGRGGTAPRCGRRRRDRHRNRRGRRPGQARDARQRQDRRGDRAGGQQRCWPDRGRQLRRHRPARTHRAAAAEVQPCLVRVIPGVAASTHAAWPPATPARNSG